MPDKIEITKEEIAELRRCWNLFDEPSTRNWLQVIGYISFMHNTLPALLDHIDAQDEEIAKEPFARGYDAEWSHELILTFTAGMPERGGPVARADNIRTDVWVIPVVGVGREAEGHPAPFPVALVGSAMAVMTAAGERVFEPFAGAGTTLIAAEKLGRRCHAMEIEPRYVDVTIRRWENATGGKAVRVKPPAKRTAKRRPRKR